MLRYTWLFLFATMCCVMASDQTDTTVNVLSDFLAPGKQLLSPNGQLLSPAQQIIYIYGLNQWKMQNAINLVDKIGNDYVVTPGIGAHKLHVRKLQWNKARKICIQEGGHLAIINSNSEEKMLLRMLEEEKLTQAWLGIHDLYEESDWNTVKGETLESTGYSKWKVNQPDNYAGKQHCGVLLKESGMDDAECITSNSFFCEISF